ncbi:MAG: hypothetical protein HYX72_02620 [Acidobacteria bacterium]|nr:hypothetical protein [Acidobacteriota bacterium]
MKRIVFVVGLLLIAQLGFAQSPTVGGVVNGASYALAGLPNSGIGQGSIFIIFGTNMGPAALAGAPRLPLELTLAGTSVNVTTSTNSVVAPIIYTSAGQVAAVMPSNAGLGPATVTVTYNGRTSGAFSIQVVDRSFGFFTINQQGSGSAIILDGDFRQINLLNAAAPNQTVAAFGTGLGRLPSGSDAEAPPQVNLNVPAEVYVGNRRATVVYTGRTGGFVGLDQINFQIPAGVEGCNVPLVVRVGSTVSNFAAIPVSSSGPCSDQNGLSSAALALLNSTGSLRVGTVSLSRNTSQITLPPPLPSQTTTSETGSASFMRFNRDALVGSLSGLNQAIVGSCAVFQFSGQNSTPSVPTFTALDAGTAINVSGPNGNRTLSKGTGGFYSGTLSSQGQPAFLGTGTFSASGTGGVDVGAFQANITGVAVTWTNADSISTVARSQDLNIRWSGGGSGFVTISGTSLGSLAENPVGAGFICVAPANAGQFTVPSYVLQALPPSPSGGGQFAIPSGFLFVGGQSINNFSAQGLDQAMIVYSDSTGKSVTFQ